MWTKSRSHAERLWRYTAASNAAHEQYLSDPELLREYEQFLDWQINYQLQFYADFRWEGWADEVQAVGLDQALSVWPPLGSAEARPIAKTSRRPVPRTELEKTHNEISQQLGPRFFI